MNKKSDSHDVRSETKRLVASHTLKRCTFCGAVNAIANKECFVCTWHGSFDTNPKELEEGVQQLFHRYPELAIAMFEQAALHERHKSWWQKLAFQFASLLRGKRRAVQP